MHDVFCKCSQCGRETKVDTLPGFRFEGLRNDKPDAWEEWDNPNKKWVKNTCPQTGNDVWFTFTRIRGT